MESAWERGLRHAKEVASRHGPSVLLHVPNMRLVEHVQLVPQVLKKATIRKEQEPDFEEKRFNVTIGEDDREFDKENEFFRERSYRIIREYDPVHACASC